MAWPNFSVTDGYAALVAGINTAFQSVGKLFKDQTTGDFTDQVRYNSSLGRLEYWTGSAWAALPMGGTAAGTANTLATARTIGGVSFNGSANINLPGVNTAGNQNTSGNAATASALQTIRNIGGVPFNGTGDINLPGVNTAGYQNTSGSAASCTGNAATATALSTAAGPAPSYAARATGYATFSDGTPSLVFGQNITSVTDIGTGRVKFNFAYGPGTTSYVAVANIYITTIGDRQGGVYNVETTGVTTYGSGGDNPADYPVMLVCYW